MKPVKALLPFATWLMRLSVVFFVYVIFFSALKGFEIKSIQFYVAFVNIVFGTLLFIGGFMSKPAITVFSGIMLFLVSAYRIFMLLSGGFDSSIALYFIVGTVSLFFVTTGNKK